MSKKRIAASILVILVAVLINVLIINYRLPVKNYNLELKVTMTSDEPNGMKVYYLNGKKTLEEGFTEDDSQIQNYKKANVEKTLTYTVPGDTDYVRLDFGEGASKTVIQSMELVNGKVVLDITDKAMESIEQENDSAATFGENALLIESQGKDPYIVFDTADWKMDQVIVEAKKTMVTVVKTLLCIFLDFIFMAILLFAKKFAIIPRELWQNKRLILQLSKNDFKTKYAGSYLGIVWAFIQPIITVLVYWFVFQKGLKAGGMNTSAGITVPFVLWLVAGLVPWFFFQDSLNGGTNALVEYSYLVKKVVFKISILPIVKVVSALFVHAFFIMFTLILYGCYGYLPDGYTLQILYYSFATFMIVLGVTYATCALVVFFRDLTQIINIVLQVGVWMTPIMWNIDTMDLSPTLISIFKLNPMYYIVAGYRDSLINKVWFWENPGMTIYFWIVTVMLFGIGITIFRRLKIHFADVL